MLVYRCQPFNSLWVVNKLPNELLLIPGGMLPALPDARTVLAVARRLVD